MLTSQDASLTALKPSFYEVQSTPLNRARASQQLLVSPEHEGGVILQKPFYADFIGPGALLGDRLDAGYTAMYLIGTVQFCTVMTLEERSKARQRRLVYNQRLVEIAHFYDSRRRAIAIIQQMCEWVGEENVQLIPSALLGQLAGVLPKTIKAAWQQRAEHCQCRFVAPDRGLER